MTLASKPCPHTNPGVASPQEAPHDALAPPRVLVLLFCVSAACGCDAADTNDAANLSDALDALPATVHACTDFDVTGLTSANVSDYVAKYQGQPCVGPLVGGSGGLLQECGFGGDLLVCGQSAGPRLFGCSCVGAQLTCVDGLKVREGQEKLCADVVDGGDSSDGDIAIDTGADTDCHHDCIGGGHTCADGIVSTQQKVAVPCANWTGKCQIDADRAPDYVCKERADVAGQTSKQCIRKVDACPCSASAKQQALWTACAVLDGNCVGA